MEKYGISQKLQFQTGTYEQSSDANFNYQLGRIIMWNCGDSDEAAAVSHRVLH